MRMAVAFCAIALVAVVPGTAKPVRFNTADSTDIEALKAEMIKNPPHLSEDRLPRGTKIGKCLLVVNGQTRISGLCFYSIEKYGDFHIDGPRQSFDGVDYPKARAMAEIISTDWWANVYKLDGVWSGYSNEVIGSVHGQESRWGVLTRDGACYFNRPGPEVVQIVRVCLWKK